jgi:hypothetical protein
MGTSPSPFRYYFVDMECVQLDSTGSDGSPGLLIKELCVLDYISGRTSTFNFFPPKRLNEDSLSDKIKAANNFLKYKRHGLSFNSGLIQFERLPFIMRVLFGQDSCKYILFVKGQQKLELLAKTITFAVHIINLEHFQCPRYMSRYASKFSKCLLYSENLKRLHEYCAESKVKYYADWFHRVGFTNWKQSSAVCFTCKMVLEYK